MIFEKLPILLFFFAKALGASIPNPNGMSEYGPSQSPAAKKTLRRVITGVQQKADEFLKFLKPQNPWVREQEPWELDLEQWRTCESWGEWGDEGEHWKKWGKWQEKDGELFDSENSQMGLRRRMERGPWWWPQGQEERVKDLWENWFVGEKLEQQRPLDQSWLHQLTEGLPGGVSWPDFFDHLERQVVPSEWPWVKDWEGQWGWVLKRRGWDWEPRSTRDINGDETRELLNKWNLRMEEHNKWRRGHWEQCHSTWKQIEQERLMSQALSEQAKQNDPKQ